MDTGDNGRSGRTPLLPLPTVNSDRTDMATAMGDRVGGDMGQLEPMGFEVFQLMTRIHISSLDFQVSLTRT